MGKLDGKVALITGGGSGIGRATALLFAREGASLGIADCGLEGGRETVKMVEEAGGDALFIEVDVSQAADAERMVREVVSAYGRVDILHNNAAARHPFVLGADLEEQDWDRVVSVNLKGVFLGSKYAIPVMIKQGGGAIVNMASTAGLVGLPNNAGYAASKGGVIQLTKTLALEYAQYGIRVNCICPGGTLTPGLERWIPTEPEARDAFLQGMSGGRPIYPEEMAKAVLFLSCDDSSSAIGAVLVIDRGHTAA